MASYNTGDYHSESKTYSYGGNAIIDSQTDAAGISAAYTSWANSFVLTGSGWNCNIVVDKNLVLYPIWELLPDGDRKTELYNAYMAMSMEQDISFFEKYVYNMPEQNIPDYSDYEIVYTPEQFSAIRNDLNGKYVLACNIDLENEVNYRRLNNELKCLNILYEVLGIKGTKEEIIEEYHHLIN